MKLISRSLLMLLVAILLAGCPQPRESKSLSETLNEYETFVRWAQWDAASNFIAPEYQEQHPITRLDLERLRFERGRRLRRFPAPPAVVRGLRHGLPEDRGRGDAEAHPAALHPRPAGYLCHGAAQERI